MLILDKMCKRYHLRPSSILIPDEKSEQIKLAVDLIVFRIGNEDDMKREKEAFELEMAKLQAMGAYRA